MNILTFDYLCLVIISLLGVKLVKQAKGKKIFLLVLSIFFYAYWDIRFVISLLLYTLFIFKMAILSSRSTGKKSAIITGAGIISSVLLLFYFKYMKFFLKEIFGLPEAAIHIIVPIGLSFIILSAIGYLLDVYKGKYKANQDIVEVMLFLCYFPKLLSGPIERQNEFSKKINEMIPISKGRLWQGMQIILFGLIKKMVIADRVGVCVDAVFRCPELYSAPSILWAMISYTIQIYCDFSGYTDIARGVSYLLGISLEKNFDLPYSALNPGEFWRRWHISLSSWFKDYVYIPLGGSRSGRVKTYKNIMLTMLLSGIWHGANWTYWLWGIIHGIAQCICRLWGGLREKYLPNKNSGAAKVIARVCNLVFICITWTIFRADSINQFLLICKRVITLQQGIDYFYVWTGPYAVIIAGATAYGYKKNNGHGLYPEIGKMNFLGQVVFWVAVFLVIGFAYMGNMAFIYNNF